MISNRISFLMTKLNATNTAIAYYAGCNASSISRLRTGARTPGKNSPTIKKFLNGVVAYARNNNLYKVLCSIYCGNITDCDNEIKKKLSDWIYENYDIESEAECKTSAFSFFGEKLDAVMNMINMSNVRLGKIISLDPSYISRFRSGVRTPKSNFNLVNIICNTLLDKICEQNKTEQLASMMNISALSITDNEELKRVFLDWMCDVGSYDNESAIDNLLDSIDTFTAAMGYSIPSLDEVVSEDILSDNSEYYSRLKGLQMAVIRFLASAINNNTKELLLYSDQDMSWMTGDREFWLKWLTLMSECVSRGIKIKIVHNIDRELSEMISAIESWLPLYMSGMIEPYVCKKNADGRFSHTLFICPDVAYIEACHIRGFEEKGIYNYVCSNERITIMKQEFGELLKKCEPLLRIFTEKDKNNYLFTSKQVSAGGMKSILNSLSFASIPQDLLYEILEQSNIEESERKNILDFWKVRNRIFMEKLENEYVYEFISIADYEDLASGKIELELGSIMSKVNLYYTKDNYVRHIKHIVELLERYSNYRIYVLPETAFSNMQLIIEGNKIVVIKRNMPRVAFVFTNKLMQEAFCEYINRLKERNKHDRQGTVEILMRCKQ